MLAFTGHAAHVDLSLPGLGVVREPVETGAARFDLCLYLSERRHGDGTPAGIDGIAEYSTDLFDPATAQRLTRRLVRFLAAVAADPGLRVEDVDLPGDDEERRPGRWNSTAEGIPRSRPPLRSGNRHPVARTPRHRRTTDSLTVRRRPHSRRHLRPPGDRNRRPRPSASSPGSSASCSSCPKCHSTRISSPSAATASPRSGS